MSRVLIEGLEVKCVVGAWDWERLISQPLFFDIEMVCDVTPAAESDQLDDAVNYAAVAERVETFAIEAKARLLERLAVGVAELIVEEFGVTGVRVRVAKPGAISAAKTVAVVVERGEI